MDDDVSILAQEIKKANKLSAEDAKVIYLIMFSFYIK